MCGHSAKLIKGSTEARAVHWFSWNPRWKVESEIKTDSGNGRKGVWQAVMRRTTRSRRGLAQDAVPVRPVVSVSAVLSRHQNRARKASKPWIFFPTVARKTVESLSWSIYSTSSSYTCGDHIRHPSRSSSAIWAGLERARRMPPATKYRSGGPRFSGHQREWNGWRWDHINSRSWMKTVQLPTVKPGRSDNSSGGHPGHGAAITNWAPADSGQGAGTRSSGHGWMDGSFLLRSNCVSISVLKFNCNFIFYFLSL
jgi:hypothetical protein